MKRFQFRLQRVLDVNEIREEQAQRRLADAERARGLQREAADAAESAVSNHLDESRQALKTVVCAGDALLQHRFGMKLQRQAGEAVKRLTHLSEMTSDRRKELIEAARRRMMLEKLKEKKLDEHRTGLGIAEMNEMDEMAGRRFLGEQALKESNA